MKGFKDHGFGMFEGRMVPLDSPMVEFTEEAQPKLNSPARNTSGSKKYVVYVKNPSTGNVKKISFGDAKGGLTSKINDPEARKSFAARHKCDQQNDKMSAAYWACRLPRYAQKLGLKGSGAQWW